VQDALQRWWRKSPLFVLARSLLLVFIRGWTWNGNQLEITSSPAFLSLSIHSATVTVQLVEEDAFELVSPLPNKDIRLASNYLG